MKIGGSVVSSSFIFPHPPDEKRKKSCAKINLRKARELELATLDEQSTSSGITEPGGKGRYL